MITGEDRSCAASYRHIGNSLCGKPCKDSIRITAQAAILPWDRKLFAANRNRQQRSQILGSRLPTAAVQADRRSRTLAGSQQGQGLIHKKSVAEDDRRRPAP